MMINLIEQITDEPQSHNSRPSLVHNTQEGSNTNMRDHSPMRIPRNGDTTVRIRQLSANGKRAIRSGSTPHMRPNNNTFGNAVESEKKLVNILANKSQLQVDSRRNSVERKNSDSIIGVKRVQMDGRGSAGNFLERKVMLDNNYAEIDAKFDRQLESDCVKGLDNWRLEIKRKKSIIFFVGKGY